MDIPRLQVHSIETFGTHDGPGIRLVLFLQGCNMRCLYCQNPDSQNIKGGSPLEIEEIIRKLENQREYMGETGGLTVSGGEPTLQTKALIQLFQEVRKLGFHTALDTNGALDTPEVRHLYELTDLLLLDIKHIDDDTHRKLTTHPNTNPLRLAQYREDSGNPMWLRYVLVPGWNDTPDVLHRFGSHFQTFTQITRVQILPYHTLGVHKYENLGKDYPLKGVQPPSQESILEAQAILSEYLPNVTIR